MIEILIQTLEITLQSKIFKIHYIKNNNGFITMKFQFKSTVTNSLYGFVVLGLLAGCTNPNIPNNGKYEMSSQQHREINFFGFVTDVQSYVLDSNGRKQIITSNQQIQVKQKYVHEIYIKGERGTVVKYITENNQFHIGDYVLFKATPNRKIAIATKAEMQNLPSEINHVTNETEQTSYHKTYPTTYHDIGVNSVKDYDVYYDNSSYNQVKNFKPQQ